MSLSADEHKHVDGWKKTLLGIAHASDDDRSIAAITAYAQLLHVTQLTVQNERIAEVVEVLERVNTNLTNLQEISIDPSIAEHLGDIATCVRTLPEVLELLRQSSSTIASF